MPATATGPSKSLRLFTLPRGRRQSHEPPLTLSAVRLVNPITDKPAAGRGPEEGGVSAIRKILRMLGADQRGATAIEYGLIAALIIVAMIAGLQGLGGAS